MMRSMMMGAVLVLSAGGAAAGTHSLDGLGTVDMFGSGFDGADSAPFFGIGDGDAIVFHMEFDANAAAVSDNGLVATYEFLGGGSFFQMGQNVTSIETLSITVGTSGFIRFHAMNLGLGFSANMDFVGLDPFASTALPGSFDLADGGFGELDADSSLNQFLLPIVLGSAQSATITPTPGTGLVMLGGAMVCGRRRRR